jgi:hypothetical protein
MHRLIMLKRPLAILLVAASLAGCYKLKPETHIGAPARFSKVPPPAERELGELRWGLALSGGGIRAALFSMGAMKRLYEAGLMDSVQVVSTVSGGGYMAYWLYTREYQRPSVGRFGRNTFEADEFRVGMCEVELTSNFYSYGEMLKTLAGRETLVEGYNYALLRTFGHAVHDTVELERSGELKDIDPELQIHHLAARVRERTLPHFVVNATVVDPLPRQGWKDGLYEMTPLFRGNEAYGYAPWDGTSSMPLRQAIAISGAAYRKGLKQPIPNPHPAPRQPTLTLADGGGSENLGAVALVRRRVKNIIVVDAAHDPHYGFVAYENLQKRLLSWGYALDIPSIRQRSRRERLAAGAHVGTVTSMVQGDTFSANIYYIKMSSPVSLDSVLVDSVADRGEEIDERVTKALAGSATSSDADWNCEVLRSFDYTLRDRFVYAVRHYSAFVPERRRRSSPLNFVVTDFPQYTTADQSFYRDQTTAFVGLGYLLTQEMVSAIPGFGPTARE